jgi:hypothetical protein
MTSAAAATQFADPDFLEELLGWIRLSERERRQSPDGFTAETLALDPIGVGAMRALRSSALLRRRCDALGLAKAMGAEAGHGV